MGFEGKLMPFDDGLNGEDERKQIIVLLPKASKGGVPFCSGEPCWKSRLGWRKEGGNRCLRF